MEILLVLVSGLLLGVGNRNVAAESEPSYATAFASFGPGNTEIFVADQLKAAYQRLRKSWPSELVSRWTVNCLSLVGGENERIVHYRYGYG